MMTALHALRHHHDPLARAEAAVCRWMPVRPTDGQLEWSVSASSDGCRRHVSGPHLRCLRKTSRSNIGVPGICRGVVRRYGRTEAVFYVNLGSTSRRVYTRTLGIPEAFRRALALRAKWEELVEAANRAILSARERNTPTRRARA